MRGFQLKWKEELFTKHNTRWAFKKRKRKDPYRGRSIMTTGVLKQSTITTDRQSPHLFSEAQYDLRVSQGEGGNQPPWTFSPLSFVPFPQEATYLEYKVAFYSWLVWPPPPPVLSQIPPQTKPLLFFRYAEKNAVVEQCIWDKVYTYCYCVRYSRFFFSICKFGCYAHAKNERKSF